MLGVESYRRVLYARCYSLSVILAALNADDDQVGSKPRFELPQLRKYMDAVDSPISPEIEENGLSAKVDETKRLAAGVNPVDVFRKFRRSYRRSSRKFSRHLSFRMSSKPVLHEAR